MAVGRSRVSSAARPPRPSICGYSTAFKAHKSNISSELRKRGEKERERERERERESEKEEEGRRNFVAIARIVVERARAGRGQ